MLFSLNGLQTHSTLYLSHIYSRVQAAKKAKDFEVRKLKRRLRLIALAENKPVNYSSVKEKDDSSTATEIKSEPSAEPNIKT